MTNQRRPAKRIYLINRDFQLRYAFAAVLVGLVSTILTAAVVLWPLYVFQILRIPRFLPWPILGAMGFAALINILLIGMLGVFVTHRIAGPMFSLVHGLRRVELGFWSQPIRLRASDELGFVVRNFNAMVEALSESLKEDMSAVESCLAQLEAGSGDSAKAGLAQLRDRLIARMNSREQEPNS